MRQEKDIEIRGTNFHIKQMSATMGRKMLLEYPKQNMPKIGEYSKSEELMLEVMKDCVQIKLSNGAMLPLDKTLIDQHLDLDTLVELEREVLAYSSDFFTKESLCNFVGAIGEILLNQLSQILMVLFSESSPKDSQLSTNSKQSTP
jgi:hypothetical protein